MTTRINSDQPGEPPPRPQDMLATAIEAVRLMEPGLETPDGRCFAFVPRTHELKDITDPDKLPPVIRATVTVDDRESLIAYANRFSDTGSILVADYDVGLIGARLDWHMHNAAQGEPLAPRLARHAAVLKLRPSEEFARWDKFEGEMHGQAEFAAFLEENSVDVVDPEPGILIEISRDLEATQDVTFKSSTRLENGDRGFVYETETRTRGEVKVPREFSVEIPLYNGEPPILIRAALRFRIQPGGLALGFEWRRVEYARRSHFNRIATEVAEGTGLPVVFGRTTA